MEYYPARKEITCNKELNNLDKFVFDFIKILEKHVDYVIVSGYVSILLGRSRATEDIDLLIPKMSFEEFEELWKKIYESKFECLNTSNPKEAFEMLKEHAIRFSKNDAPIPNIKFKLISDKVQRYSLKSKIKLIMKDKKFFISPLEMQIAYKLYLGSQKDLEDAKHLYEIFKEKLNKQELVDLIERFKVSEKFKVIR